MSFEQVLNNLNILEATPSTNEKVRLLKSYLKDKVFLRMVKFTLNGDMHYHIKKLPIKKEAGLKSFSTDDIFNFLKKLSIQTGTNNIDKNHLLSMLTKQYDYEIVKRIVTKDLKCGVSAKLINKALPGTINTVPYQRCSTDKKINNITYEAIIQEKADGMFVNVMINKKGQIKIITRNGKTVHQLEFLKKVIRKGRGLIPKKAKKKINLSTKYGILNNLSTKHFSMVYTGELLIRKEGKILPRKTGNGILNSCLHGTADPADAKCAVLHIWDCLPLQSFYEGYYDILYNTRMFKAEQFVHAVNDSEFVDTVMTKRVSSYEEAHDFYAEIRKAGGEGAILKNLDAIWKDHTSPNMVKLKNIIDFDLMITGWKPGKEGSKYELCMGAIQCQSSCGKLNVFVGSGFSDAEREMDWDSAIGKIATILCESVIKDKRKDTYSLFLPRYENIREDLDEAQSLSDIMNR